MLLDHEHNQPAGEPNDELVPEPEQPAEAVALMPVNELGAAFVQESLLDSACSDNCDDDPNPHCSSACLGGHPCPTVQICKVSSSGCSCTSLSERENRVDVSDPRCRVGR